MPRVKLGLSQDMEFFRLLGDLVARLDKTGNMDSRILVVRKPSQECWKDVEDDWLPDGHECGAGRLHLRGFHYLLR
jgi:hypothetical protein